MNAYRFRPNEPITMGEFSQMAVNGLQIPLSITASHFTDVPRGHPAFKYIVKSARAHPDKKVTGAQAARILAGLLKKNIPAPSNPDPNLTRGEAAQLVYQHL